jgi:hypothetical protein
MARIRPEDVQLWTSVLTAAMPAVGIGVQGVIGLINLFRRAAGEPENQPQDLLLAAEVLASIEKAKGPWQQVANNADQELKG